MTEGKRIHKKPLSGYCKGMEHGDGYILDEGVLKALIPLRYQVYDMLHVSDHVESLGIFPIHHSNEKEPYYLYLPAIIEMYPSSTNEVRIEDEKYLSLEFVKGDIFIKSRTIVKQDFLIYSMFKEFVRLGNIPPFLSYNQLAMLFDVAQITCGAVINVPHTAFEMMMAYCARDPKDLTKKYRLTDMKKPPVFLGLGNTTHARETTMPKLMGSYFMDGINNAVVNQSTQESELENLLRS